MICIMQPCRLRYVNVFDAVWCLYLYHIYILILLWRITNVRNRCAWAMIDDIIDLSRSTVPHCLAQLLDFIFSKLVRLCNSDRVSSTIALISTARVCCMQNWWSGSLIIGHIDSQRDRRALLTVWSSRDTRRLKKLCLINESHFVVVCCCCLGL